MSKQTENVVFVVKVSEQSPCHGNDFNVRVFSTREKAEIWVDAQIAALVAEHDLNRETAVDGWFVEIAHDQTVQFDVLEEEVI